MKSIQSYFIKRFLFAALIISPYLIQAQKVAVVLSGGGAKGLSHVGVLKALEENHIPIDYIVGNSIGALVGAMYAIGYSPEEIEEFVQSKEFIEWVSGNIDQHSYYSIISDPNASWVSMPFSIKQTFQSRLPSSVVSPHLMDFAVMNLFSSASAAANYNFDHLFVPFRCVAADIDSTKLIVLKSGQLGASVRASTTFPFYISPIRIDNRLLFDGGMYNNFPTDIAESEFKPDFIIGSKAAGNYPPSEESDIVSQVQNMLMRKSDFNISIGKGLVIESKLGRTGVLDFSKIETYIDSGYSAAMEQMETLKLLIQNRSVPDSINAARDRFKAHCRPLTFDTIVIKGVNSHQARNIRSRLNHHNKLLSINEITENYMALLMDDKFSNIYPQMYFDTIKQDFELHLDITMADKFMAQFGGNISSSGSNEAFIALKYRFLQNMGGQFGVNGYYGRFYSSFQANALFELTGSMPIYIDFTGNLARKDYFSNTNYFFEDPTPAFLMNDERFIDVNIGHIVKKYNKIAVGIGYAGRNFDYYQSNSFTRNDTADQTDFSFVIPHFVYEYNSLNRKQFANKGMRLMFSAKYFNGNEINIPGTFGNSNDTLNNHHSFFQLKFLYDNYFAHVNRLHFGFLLDIVASNQELLMNTTSTVLSSPVFVPIPEMQSMYLDRYRAFCYAGGGLKTIFDLFKNMDLRAEIYIFQPYQRIVDQGVDTKPTLGPTFSDPSFTLSGRFVYRTPIGPVSLSFNYFDRSGDKYAIMFNFGYLIFNRSMFD